jgi:hypothetical protein
MQDAIDTWEFSLKTTCGAIVPERQYGGSLVFNGMALLGNTIVYKTPQAI